MTSKPNDRRVTGLADHDRLPWRFFGLMSTSDGRG